MGKGSATTTKNETKAYSANPLTQQYANKAFGALDAADPISGMRAQDIAGFTPDQHAAFQNIRNVQGQTNPYFQAAQNYLQRGSSPLDLGRVEDLYKRQSDPVFRSLNDTFGQQMKETTGNLVQAAGGTGASRIGVGQAQLAKQQGLAAGDVGAKLYQQALDQMNQEKMRQQSAAVLSGNLGIGDLGARLQEIGALQGAGQQQQQLAQLQADAPWAFQNMAAMFPYQKALAQSQQVAGLAPALGGTTTGHSVEEATKESDPLGTIAGLGMTGLGLAGGLGWKPLAGKGAGGRVSAPTAFDKLKEYAYGGAVDGGGFGVGSDPEAAGPWGAKQWPPPLPPLAAPQVLANAVPSVGLPAQAQASAPMMQNGKGAAPSGGGEIPRTPGEDGGFEALISPIHKEGGGLIEGNLSDYDLTMPNGTTIPAYNPDDPKTVLPVEPGTPNPPPMPGALESNEGAGFVPVGQPFRRDPNAETSNTGTGGGPTMPGTIGLPRVPDYPNIRAKDRGEMVANPWMALLQAGLGTLAAGSETDRRGIPIGGLAAIGRGGQRGIEFLQQQQKQVREDERAERAAQKMLFDAQKDLLPYDRETASQRRGHDILEKQVKSGEWQYLGPSAENPEVGLYQSRRSGETKEGPLAAAKPTAPKPMPTAAAKDVTEVAKNFHSLGNLVSNFDDSYAGKPIQGPIENWAARNLAIGDEKIKAQANWWQGYAAYKSQVRHELYGAALTGYEIAQWEQQDIKPGMSPDLIKENLARQKRIVDGALRRKAEGWLADGYRKEAIEARLGLKMEDLPKPVDEAGKWKGAFSTKIGGGEKPKKEGAQLSKEDQQALDWANANPNDPRAAKIKQKLGVQ